MNPQATATILFISVDQQNWAQAQACFADEVTLDYSSFSGEPATTLRSDAIIESWKGFLPGFKSTHHQLGNFLTQMKEDQATIFFYGTATHFLEAAEGNLWSVVGSYELALQKGGLTGWQITTMKFNFAYQDGNLSLPEKARQIVQGAHEDTTGEGEEQSAGTGAAILEDGEAGQARNQEIMTRNKGLVRSFFQLLETEDIPAFLDLFAENGKQINPYASGLFPEGATGKEALRQYWEPVPGNFDGMQFILHEVLGMEDPNMVYTSYTGKIKLKNDAGFYENQYYSTFKFDAEGKILEYVEIFNPVVAAKGFGLLAQLTGDQG